MCNTKLLLLLFRNRHLINIILSLFSLGTTSPYALTGTKSRASPQGHPAPLDTDMGFAHKGQATVPVYKDIQLRWTRAGSYGSQLQATVPVYKDSSLRETQESLSARTSLREPLRKNDQAFHHSSD